MIIQVTNNNNLGWTGIARLSFAVSVILFAKDVTEITIYVIRKFIDNKDNPDMRPAPSRAAAVKAAQRDIYLDITPYLLDPNDEGIDEDGNTSIHYLQKYDDLTNFDRQIKQQPHVLFMLNKAGLTSLDVSITEKELAKSKFLIDKTQKFNNGSSFKFVKRPNRLDLKYEKAFCLAVQNGILEAVDIFPARSVKSVLVTMSQLNDYKKYKGDKRVYKEVVVTPIHLACQKTAYEAVYALVEQHAVEINVLHQDRTPLYELISVCGYQDFKILNYLMKKKRPCINAGSLLPLNQAILRGNPMIIKGLIEGGRPHPFRLD